MLVESQRWATAENNGPLKIKLNQNILFTIQTSRLDISHRLLPLLFTVALDSEALNPDAAGTGDLRIGPSLELLVFSVL